MTVEDKTPSFPMPAEVEDRTWVEDPAIYRICPDKLIKPQPELFLAKINSGYCFYEFVKSYKLHL
jgi:hypothetical protein